MKKIFVAEGAGFCFGVKRAIDIAFDIARKYKDEVCTLGPIIHNPQVVRKLRELGVESFEDIPPNKKVRGVIIRAHGITKEKLKELQDLKYEIIDATCPFVKKAQSLAEELSLKKYQVIIVGDKNHPEVKGILSYAEGNAVVVGNLEDIPTLSEKIGIIQQTTQPLKKVKRIVMRILSKIEDFEEIRIFNTLCNFTAKRLKATERIAKKVDLMIVVGGRNSANTTQLANLCRELGVETYHIESAEEIRKEWFSSVEKIGLTAGASTPQWVIEEVMNKIGSFINEGGNHAESGRRKTRS